MAQQGEERAHFEESGRTEEIERRIRSGDIVGGEEEARSVLARALAAGWEDTQGECWRCLALAQNWRGAYAESLSSCLAAIPLLDARQRHASLAHARSLAGVNLARLGQTSESIEQLLLAIELARASGARLIEAQTLVNLGIVYGMLRDYRMALEVTEQARALATHLGNDDLWAAAVMNLSGFSIENAAWRAERGEAHPEADQTLGLAVELADAAYEKFRAMENEAQCSACLENKGEALVLLRRFDEAEDVLNQARALSRRTGARDMEAATLLGLADIESQRGRHRRALGLLEEALDYVQRTEDQEQIGRTWLALSRVHEALAQHAEALAAFRAYHDCSSRLVSEQSEARARVLTLKLDIERTRAEAEINRRRAADLAARNEKLAAEAELLNRQALEDSLTGLPNRRHLNHQLAHVFDTSVHEGRPLYLAVADVDHFKAVNDRYSHAVGDQVLRQVARVLIAECRPSDFVGRLGGEEFVVIFDCDSLEQARLACERLRHAVDSFDWEIFATGLRVTLSLGVAALEGQQSADELLDCADRALYEAKRSGRNRVATFRRMAPEPQLSSPNT